MSTKPKERLVVFADVERRAQLQADIQQYRVEMVYGSLLERRRLQRRIAAAETEICRMVAPAVGRR